MNKITKSLVKRKTFFTSQSSNSSNYTVLKMNEFKKQTEHIAVFVRNAINIFHLNYH